MSQQMPWWRAAWNKAKAAIQPPGVSRVIRTGRTAAGVWIDPDAALKNATVWACIRYLSHAVAQTPWRVYRPKAGGGRELMTGHPSDWLLNKRPSPDMGSFTWRQSMLSFALRYGNGYAEIERDMRGSAVAMWPIHPNRVRVRRDPDTNLLVYDVSQPSVYAWGDSTPSPGGLVTLEGQDVFHMRGFGEGPVGYNVIEYAAQSLGWAQATELFGATFFGEGMNPSGVITKKGKLTPEGLEELRKDTKRFYEGPRGERTLILDQDMSFDKVATQPNDAQFIETRQHQIDEICRWFGVPPHKVMNLLRATFSNIEQQSIEVVVDSVTPWCKTMEEEADYKLFGSNRQNLYTKMDLRALLRGDSVSRAKYLYQMWGMGAFSINKVLEFEGEDPIGPKGDVRFVPAAFTTLDLAIEGPAPVPNALDPNAPPVDPAALPKLPGEAEPDEDPAEVESTPPAAIAPFVRRFNR